MDRAQIDVGRRLAGKYELVRLLGRGAMGEVWLARHETLGGEFAIKVVKPSDDITDDSAAGRFQLEAQISAKLSRKTRHIVSVSDHGEEDGIAYLVMELLDGESLDARIQREGPLDLPTTVGIVSQVARALVHAHAEGIFHRDLKPANLFLTKDEDGRLLVKLLDFGIARTNKPFRTRSPFMTGKDMVLGTPSYMSPEQARGLDTLDHRCDLWALAVVAYEALTGHIPWAGESVEDIFLSICTHRMTPLDTYRPDLGDDVAAVFARSFDPKLDARYATADELAVAFDAVVDPAEVDAAMGGAPPSARRMPPASRLSQPDAQKRAPSPSPAPAPPSRPVDETSRDSERFVDGAALRGELARNDAGSDPVGFSVGGGTMRSRRRSSTGWIFAAAAGLATIAVVGLAFLALRGDRGAAVTEPPATTTTATATTVALPPATTSVATAPPPTAEATAEPNANTSPATTSKPGTRATAARAGTRPKEATPTGAGPATTAAATATAAPPSPAPPTPATAATPAHAPAPTATAKAPHDKSEVF